jgi:hypothetical protein
MNLPKISLLRVKVTKMLVLMSLVVVIDNCGAFGLWLLGRLSLEVDWQQSVFVMAALTSLGAVSTVIWIWFFRNNH